ncbi:udp-transferase [Colletotrichum plurivorum]|uniref:Udp-transferase n=1 Tax=Colletotrichum plurivorum TaxID=2175906 RepID=A0A8H6N8Q0_9PEZI|nr:udp-transferase [Colletotrichum plurivorum]
MSSSNDEATAARPSVRLNIAILFMGSRGDLHPALAIARRLQEHHGHQVRIATHPPYRAAIEAAGVGFYSIGSCDVKTMIERRLLPREELQKVLPVIKEEFREMGERWWGACIDAPEGLVDGEKPSSFVADCVISTVHVFNQTSAAARLGIPLHLFGMNPRTYSGEIPHSQAGWAVGAGRMMRLVSWWLPDAVFLQVMKGVINDVRVGMGLEPMSPAWWPSQHHRLGVPCSYLWSPRLMPAPSDWAENVRVSGFVWDDTPGDYVPSADLVAFLGDGNDAPVCIGFGSGSFADAQGTFERIVEAVRMVGVRAVICRGWSNLSAEAILKDNEVKSKRILVVDEAPHAWLFPRVRAVVCHGGLGTTAAALRSGRPTLIVPVTGDQPFWASKVAAAGCGPEAGFGIEELTAEGLRGKMEELLRPEFAKAAGRFAREVARERPGEEACVEEIVRTLEVYDREGCRCEVFPERPAVWRIGKGGPGLSAVAAWVLVKEGKVGRAELRTAEVVRWPDLVSPGDPVTGVVLGLMGAIGSVVGDVKGGRWGFLGLHVLRAPLTIIASVFFGLFNLLDFILYSLGSSAEPKLYASNPRLFTLPQMLGFLLRAPVAELRSVDPRTHGGGGVVWVLLGLLRAAVAVVNVPAGILGISLRHSELACARGMGERPSGDIVADARTRQGQVEAEKGGDGLREEIVRAWDSRREKKTV